MSDAESFKVAVRSPRRLLIFLTFILHVLFCYQNCRNLLWRYICWTNLHYYTFAKQNVTLTNYCGVEHVVVLWYLPLCRQSVLKARHWKCDSAAAGLLSRFGMTLCWTTATKTVRIHHCKKSPILESSISITPLDTHFLLWGSSANGVALYNRYFYSCILIIS